MLITITVVVSVSSCTLTSYSLAIGISTALTFAALAGLGDGKPQPCRATSSLCFDIAAHAASLPPVDSYDVWPYLAGKSPHSPRTELPLAAPNNAAGRPPNPWAGSEIRVNGLIYHDTGTGAIWKLLTGEIPQNQWTGPRFPYEPPIFILFCSLSAFVLGRSATCACCECAVSVL